MCWTGTFSSSPETCLPINCSVCACQWVDVYVRVHLFVCVCLSCVECVYLCVQYLNACLSLFVCVWRSILRPVVGRPARCVCFFICGVHVRSPHVVCVHISLLVCGACISTSACDLARWRGNWLVFMNKRHNCDRMMYDQNIHGPPTPVPFLFFFLLKIYMSVIKYSLKSWWPI